MKYVGCNYFSYESESPGRNKQGTKNDKACHMSRRRLLSYETDYRNGVSFGDIPLPQSGLFPYGLNSSGELLYRPWYNSPNYISQQNGVRHRYPGQQMFMQHRPFGGENNYFRPLRYPSHFSLPHSHFLDQSTTGFVEPRRSSFHYHGDNGHFDEMLNGQNRGLRNDYGQGARPKSSPFQNGKKKSYKRKKNQNNSSNISEGGDSEPKKDNVEYFDQFQETDNTARNASTKSNTFNDLQNSAIKSTCYRENDLRNPLADIEMESPHLNSDSDSLLGAVGGESRNVFQQAANPPGSSILPFDKNLIDEGAICDLDKMFQRQEFSCYAGDVEDFEEDDLDKEAKAVSPYQSVSDEDSEFENCSYVYDPKHSQTLENSHFLSHNKSGLNSLYDASKSTESKKNTVNGATALLSNSESPEDTGDFIDTDLPAQKHLLSSSDEMDSHSSSSDSEIDSPGGMTCRSHKLHQDFNSNDLSSCECEIPKRVEMLSISKESTECGSYTSSQFKNKAKDIYKEEVRSKKLSALSYNSSTSSESENDERSPSGSPIKTIVHNSVPQACYNSSVGCLDGAAASQLHVERPRSTLETHCSSCHHGAESEIAPPATLQRFHSNMFYAGAPVGGHRDNPTSTHDFYSSSFSSDVGACCSQPTGYFVSPVNDLNACFHHSHHSHVTVANGFTDRDSPGANFINDESNRLQKVFVKFSNEDKADEGESHSASCCDLEGSDGRKTEKSSDSGGSEDPLNHDNNDNVDMVLLPMEEEIEPVHHMGAGLCAGGVDEDDDLYHDISGQLATSGRLGSNTGYMCDDHQYHYALDQNPLSNGMPSKEFYELIKTVSTTDSYMRFFDKDGQDVQRQPLVPCGEDSKQGTMPGGSNSKTERLKVDRVMIWNEYEAYVMQFKQIAVSACGQTAVLNVLKALKFSCEKSAVCKVIQTSLRKEDACVPEYLFSRAKAGTTAEELMSGVEKLSNGAVGGRFFHFWPPRKIKLLQWLAYWMKRGAIPMATLNLQQGPHSLWGQVPDSWHHQMVYGVSHQGLYLTNPLEIVSERSAMRQLTSDSVLMVRRQDIISRFRETTDLGQLLNHPDPRWRTRNVLGQVVNVLREFNMPSVPGYRLQVTSHVSIPASYKAGITLFMRKDKSAWTELLSAPEIPLE